MRLELQFWNCLWLMLPLLIWNILLGPKITNSRITSDSNSPKWLLIAENAVRICVFALPLFLPLQTQTLTSKVGLTIYILGTLIYFVSWLPFLFTPNSAWCGNVIGLLAPRITPLLAFLGVALISHSLLYGVFAGFFTILHTWHGIQNLKMLA